MNSQANHNPLRIVFMGTPDFAVASLSALVETEHKVVGVITAPDKPAGRGQKLRLSPVKTAALINDIPVFQPLKLKDPDFLEQLSNLQADLFVVVAFRMLPKQVWAMPPLGTFNLHASLLPQYRGAAPINWAIIKGEVETGITTFFLNEQIDTGHILFQERTAIGADMTAGELHDILMEKGSQLVVTTVDSIRKQSVSPEPQNITDNKHQAAPKIYKEDCRIDWNQTAGVIHNLIRGLSPNPSSWTQFELGNGESIKVKILQSARCSSDEKLLPGQLRVLQQQKLFVGTKDNSICLLKIQVEGKRPMLVEDFLRGFRGVLLAAQ